MTDPPPGRTARDGPARPDSERPLTSRDIAALSGVSQATVSRVLSGSPHVRPDKRARVLETLERTAYVPNAAARVMRTRSTGVIGVVVARVSNPFYPQLVDALGAAMAARDRQMSLWIADSNGEMGALEAIQRGSIDGVVYTTVTRESRSLRAALQRRSPVVLLNRTLERVQCDKVSSDNRGGGALAARHLIGGGHRRIGLVGGPLETSTAREREDGFRQALANAGQPLDERLCARTDFSHEGGYMALGTLLALRRPPTAVFCVNDVIAFGALDAARTQGVAVPDDLWVIGFDDIEMAAWPAFSLTTVLQPATEMARVGVEHLLERIDGSGPERFRHTRLPVELVRRRSTGGPGP